jgi:5-guanidino-2-oxopentanoate decarboxylase
MRSEISAGERMVELLGAYGVETIFGIPGVHNVEAYRALPRSGIRHVLARHEQGAGFMADGYARATGKPGVCFTISGPGLTNILTPLGEAWSDSSPVFVISSALADQDRGYGRGRLHEMRSQIGAAASVCAFAERATTAEGVEDSIHAAFAAFASQRPRPAYLEVPLDVLLKPAEAVWNPRPLPARPLAQQHQIDAAAARLSAARRPLLILGGGALAAGRFAVAIAERIGAEIMTTTAGKGAVPDGHPLSLGYCLGTEAGMRRIMEADAILAVGTELSDTDFWNEHFIVTRNLIRIDIDPSVLVRPHAPDIAILGDAAEAMARLESALAAALPQPRPSPRRTLIGYPERPNGILPVLAAIRDALPPETVISTDMTQIAYAGNEIFPVSQPRTWLHPVGFGTLGFALPAAIGAKIGVAETPVAVLAGDYGFQYTANELGTASELRLPLPILLWNNHALGQIRDDMISKAIQPNAVTLENPDFQMLAKAYRCHAARPASLKELAAAIGAALKADRPTLIEIEAGHAW